MIRGNYAPATRRRSTFGGSEITLRFLSFTLKTATAASENLLDSPWSDKTSLLIAHANRVI